MFGVLKGAAQVRRPSHCNVACLVLGPSETQGAAQKFKALEPCLYFWFRSAEVRRRARVGERKGGRDQTVGGRRRIEVEADLESREYVVDAVAKGRDVEKVGEEGFDVEETDLKMYILDLTWKLPSSRESEAGCLSLCRWWPIIWRNRTIFHHREPDAATHPSRRPSWGGASRNIRRSCSSRAFRFYFLLVLMLPLPDIRVISGEGVVPINSVVGWGRTEHKHRSSDTAKFYKAVTSVRRGVKLSMPSYCLSFGGQHGLELLSSPSGQPP